MIGIQWPDFQRSSKPGRRPALRPGLSIVEMLLVLCSIAVLAAVAVPRYAGSLSRYRLDLASRRVAADLQLAAQRADACSSSQTVAFDCDSESYRLVGMASPEGTGEYVVSLSADPYQAKIVSAFGAQSAVTFNGMGIPNRSGSVVVGVGELTQTISLDASGHVSLP